MEIARDLFKIYTCNYCDTGKDKGKKTGKPDKKSMKRDARSENEIRNYQPNKSKEWSAPERDRNEIRMRHQLA